ncbi:MAG TPA: hypothetical protein PKO36_00650 [Candidatus Hydrogenedentes bacterium]|nr:hypothetical protein [Candidatus Hydrogenedentota bacterium]HOV72750.1 hypothetical protein [Candidatus Hydrogenedentota bacterium]
MRIGAPAASCVAPLVFGLADEAGIALDRAAPCELLQHLQQGTLDAALLAPTDALRVDRARIVPGIGIVFPGTAETEAILSRVPLAHIERVAIDETGGGMNDWARVLLAECFGARPGISDVSRADARIVTGLAIEANDPAFPARHDLGALWNERTGLPFVAMVWAARFGAPIPEMRRVLSMAAQRGLAETTDVPRPVSYRMGGEAMDGLRRYLDMAGRCGFLPEGGALRFC